MSSSSSLPLPGPPLRRWLLLGLILLAALAAERGIRQPLLERKAALQAEIQTETERLQRLRRLAAADPDLQALLNQPGPLPASALHPGRDPAREQILWQDRILKLLTTEGIGIRSIEPLPLEPLPPWQRWGLALDLTLTEQQLPALLQHLQQAETLTVVDALTLRWQSGAGSDSAPVLAARLTLWTLAAAEITPAPSP